LIGETMAFNFLGTGPWGLLSPQGDLQPQSRRGSYTPLPQKPTMLTHAEAAKELSISTDDLKRLIGQGELHEGHITRRKRGISRDEISRYRSASFARLPTSVALHIALTLNLPLPVNLKK